MLTLEKKLNRYPPCVCRLLAREGKNNSNMRLLEDEEIARRASMSVSQVRSLSWLTSWDRVAVADMMIFTKACGVDLSDRLSLNRHYKYLRNKRPFNYLRKHKDYEAVWSKIFQMYSEELMERYGDPTTSNDVS